jgi:hypothetical protein
MEQGMTLGNTFSPQQIQFLAEDVLTSIIPTVPIAELDLIAGKLGPFHPQVPAEVPLWLAVYLTKVRRRARTSRVGERAK